jgi:hypothetical protein
LASWKNLNKDDFTKTTFKTVFPVNGYIAEELVVIVVFVITSLE